MKTVFGAVTKHELVYRQQRIYNQRYQWPLAASLLLLLASLVVGTRRSRRRPAAVAGVLAALTMIAVPLVPTRGVAADASTPLAQYNAGTFAYRAGRYSQATQAFENSIETAPASDTKRLSDQEDAYFNLGNTLYRVGQQYEKSAPQQAIQKWTEAVKAYETALQLRADDADSKYNRDFVRRKIDALRQPPDQGGGGGGGGGGQGRGNGQGQGRDGDRGNHRQRRRKARRNPHHRRLRRPAKATAMRRRLRRRVSAPPAR